MKHFAVQAVGERAWAAIADPAGGAVANAGIVALGDGSLVFDTSFSPPAAAELRAAAEELAGPVAYAINSHAHLDHWGGNQVFAGVPIVATSRTAESIAADGPGRIEGLRNESSSYLADLEQKLAAAPDEEERSRLADELEQGRLVIGALPGFELTVPSEMFADERDFGGAVLRAPGSGHSPSDSYLWLEGERVLFAGDLISVQNHPSLMHGDPDAWLRILDELEALHPLAVVPGHGPVGGRAEIATLAGYIRELERLAAEPGEPAQPGSCRGWGYGDLFEANLAFLRERVPA